MARLPVEHERDPDDAWCDLLEQLQPLAGQRWLKIDQTGDISARPVCSQRSRCRPDRKARENDGDRARLLQHRRRRRRVCAMIRSGCNATISFANRRPTPCRRDASEYSIWTSRPSFHPSLRVRRGTPGRGPVLPNRPRKRQQHAIRRTRSGCCARAANGQVATDPPSNLMNSRRLTWPSHPR